MTKTNTYSIELLDKPDEIIVLCKHCQDMKVKPLKPTELLRHVIKRLQGGHCLAYGCYDDKRELVGGVIATSIQPMLGDPMIWIDFLWSKSNDIKIGKQMLEIIEDVAREKGFKKMGMGVSRGFAAINKEAGFTESYRVFEKEVS